MSGCFIASEHSVCPSDKAACGLRAYGRVTACSSVLLEQLTVLQPDDTNRFAKRQEADSRHCGQNMGSHSGEVGKVDKSEAIIWRGNEWVDLRACSLIRLKNNERDVLNMNRTCASLS